MKILGKVEDYIDELGLVSVTFKTTKEELDKVGFKNGDEFIQYIINREIFDVDRHRVIAFDTNHNKELYKKDFKNIDAIFVDKKEYRFFDNYII